MWKTGFSKPGIIKLKHRKRNKSIMNLFVSLESYYIISNMFIWMYFVNIGNHFGIRAKTAYTATTFYHFKPPPPPFLPKFLKSRLCGIMHILRFMENFLILTMINCLYEKNLNEWAKRLLVIYNLYNIWSALLWIEA